MQCMEIKFVLNTFIINNSRFNVIAAYSQALFISSFPIPVFFVKGFL